MPPAVQPAMGTIEFVKPLAVFAHPQVACVAMRTAGSVEPVLVTLENHEVEQAQQDADESRCCWAVRKSALLAGPATVPGVFISMGTAVPMTVFRRYEEEPPMERRASQRSGLWFFQDFDG